MANKSDKQRRHEEARRKQLEKDRRALRPLDIAAIAAGERSNSIASLLQSVLPALERERETAVRRSSAVLKTLLLCLAAAEIVLLFAALYAPILTLFASVL